MTEFDDRFDDRSDDRKVHAGHPPVRLAGDFAARARTPSRAPCPLSPGRPGRSSC
ncbi:hypothetical protein ABTZ93_37750 [Streptomyces sp. NPDC097941]|uniref:hypothetical protein n=1 Tax=Streptomyces sp. NPDC097941 TaxID=3155685 RepID=UPI00332E649A